MEPAKEESTELKTDEALSEPNTDESVLTENSADLPALKTDDNQTFKTPSFVIASKKKVKTDIEDVFRAPGSSAVKNKSDAKPSPDKIEKDSGAYSAKLVNQEKETNKTEKSIEKLHDSSSKSQIVLSPAEQLKQTQTALPYKEPAWSASCDDQYSFEIIKNGAVVDTIDLTSRCFHVVGRLPSCNIPMEHPSLSRHHAVIQHSGGSSEEFPKGWYLFDLDSTHGTWINKNKVPPKKFHRLHVDYVMKFGGSTRLFILHGPDKDREEESELSASEMKEQREKQKKEAELIKQAEIEEAERKMELLKKREEQKGCSWGIDEDDAVEEEDESAENPFASLEPENESLYINDPKKALNGYFEREGLDFPEYEFHEAGYGKWKCTIELPIDTPTGEPMIAEAVVSGKRKEAVVACALEACRLLDRHGELRKAQQESRKRKQKNWEDDDFYDSDEDTYLDRTGAIEKKRELRKTKVGKNDKVTETYDSLMEKHTSILSQIKEIEEKLEHAKAQAAAMEADDVDALDAYMSAIKSGMMDTKTKMKLKRQLMELRQEEQKVRKLVNIAKPASLPEMKRNSTSEDVKKPSLASGVGKIKGLATGKVVKKIIPNVKVIPEKEDDNEVEEEEDENVEPLVVYSESGKQSEKHTKTAVKGPTLNKDMEVVVHKSTETKTDNRTSSKETAIKQDNRSRMKGPTLPLAAVLEKLQEEADSGSKESDGDTEAGSSRKKRKTADKDENVGKKSKPGTGYKDDDPDYAVWLPPENQSGDGKTHLNEKLGY